MITLLLKYAKANIAMKRTALIILIAISCYEPGICQTKNHYADTNEISIKKAIINFLDWYKIEQGDTSKKAYSFTKGGFPDTTTKTTIDIKGVEMYLDELKKAGYFSESYLNNLWFYFKDIDDDLQTSPKTKDLIKIPGMDIDWILNTFEPEEILNNINRGEFKRISVIDNKAIVQFQIAKRIPLLFTLTRENNKWLIDYIGYARTDK